MAVLFVLASIPFGLVVGRGIRLGETGGVVARQLVTGPVLYGHPGLDSRALRCDRCGTDRPSWSWWASMFRADSDRAVGLACADCHTLPGGAETVAEDDAPPEEEDVPPEFEDDTPTRGVEK